MQVGKAIYYILANDTNVSSMVSDKIFPLVAPATTTFPFIIYEIYNDNPTMDKDGVSKLDEYDVRITAYHELYTSLCRIGSNIRVALDRVATYPSTTYSGIVVQSISFENVRDEFDFDSGRRGVYRQELQFKIRVIRVIE